MLGQTTKLCGLPDRNTWIFLDRLHILSYDTYLKISQPCVALAISLALTDYGLENSMNIQTAPYRDVGLQHLLESGLSLLQHKPLEASRRAQVMDGLVQVFSEADKGATALRSQAAFWAASEAPAFERFSVFFRYLKDVPGSDALTELSEAKAALEAMKAGEPVEGEVKQRVENLINLLLNGLRKDRLSAPLIPPLEIKFS
jgi:hypothetical protein